jgi:uncharacterized protein
MGNPLLLEDLLARHPKLRVQVMHAGYPIIDNMLTLLQANSHVYHALRPLQRIWSAAVSIDVTDDPSLVRDITVHLTFARRAFELAHWYRSRGSNVDVAGMIWSYPIKEVNRYIQRLMDAGALGSTAEFRARIRALS